MGFKTIKEYNGMNEYITAEFKTVNQSGVCYSGQSFFLTTLVLTLLQSGTLLVFNCNACATPGRARLKTGVYFGGPDMLNLKAHQLIYLVTAMAVLLVVTMGLIEAGWLAGLIVGAILLGSGIYLASRIQKSQQVMVDYIQKIAAGSFDALPEGQQSGTFAEVQDALNHIAKHYEDLFLRVITEAHRLSAIYNEFQIIISDFIHKSETMHEVAASIASATDELSANSAGISSAAEQASTTFTTISTNTDEMTHTINEISSNTERVRGIAQEAVNNVNQVTTRVGQLGQNAADISKIMDVIEDISEQTKLLALNATIEAARVGEAGKGFAVVANEVKELAGQTAEATENIKKSISTIQGSTQVTADEITGINQIINNVEENISSIASAVEEQNVTTEDISSNIRFAVEGIGDITQNIAQSAEAANSLAQDMVKISAGSKQMLTDGDNLNGQISKIGKISSSMDSLASGFRFFGNRQQKMERMVSFARLLQERERDHLNWAKKVQNAVVEHQRIIDVQKDPSMCKMGQFLNSRDRKEIESVHPAMAAIFKKMDEPHRKLHQTAARLEEMLQNPEVPDAEIENYYNLHTASYLRELLQLFHEAVDENFNSLIN